MSLPPHEAAGGRRSTDLRASAPRPSTASLRDLHRHALVTGASSGLGRAFAEMLLAEGLTVRGTARNPARLADLAAAHPGRFIPLALDLATPASVADAWQAANADSPVDLLINNAGYGVFSPSAATGFAPWRTQIDSLLTNTLALAHAALRDMLARNDGAIVNISSLAVEFPIPGMSGYNTAKAALSAWSESIAYELRATRVRIIDFRPGDFRTPFNEAAVHPAGLPPAWRRVWTRFEAMHAVAPLPSVAVRDLRRALLRQRSGLVRSGSFFQARLAPLLARLGWWRIRHAVQARYFDLK